MREVSVDFIIRPWGIPPEKRGPFEWKRVGEWYIALDGRGRVRVLLPAIFIALEKERKSKNLPGPVPEVQLLDQIVYVTGHEVLHHALKGTGLSYDQEHRAIAKIFDWIWIRRVPRLQQDQAGDFPTARQ